MQLYIQLAPNNDLYDLIQIDNQGQKCLLQDTKENCLVLFKKIISEKPIQKIMAYRYDSSTHLVTDYTNGFPVLTDEFRFIS